MMHKVPRLSLVWLGSFLSIAGCSEPQAAAQANAVDVAAAASRAQSDIANYAAVPERGSSDRSATATAAIADDAAPEVVVRRYVAALTGRRYAEAWALWDGNGQASGMTEAEFAASFARYASYRATVGAPFGADAGAGQRYVTVPVTVTGTLASGGPFRLEGPVILHKVADGIDSDAPHAHAWRIRSSEMKPRPPTA